MESSCPRSARQRGTLGPTRGLVSQPSSLGVEGFVPWLYSSEGTRNQWFWHLPANYKTQKHTYIRFVEIVEVGRTSHFETVRYPFPFLFQAQRSHLASLTNCDTPHALFGRDNTFERVGDCYGDIHAHALAVIHSNTHQKVQPHHLTPSDLFIKINSHGY